MKRVLVKILLSVLVVSATMMAIWWGGALPELAGIHYKDNMGFVCLFFYCPFMFLPWSCVAGACSAAIWKRRFRFSGDRGLLLAGAAFVAVLLVGSLLIEALPLWQSSPMLVARLFAHVSFSFFPSQVAFWGFAAVMRIGWKRRRVGS
jgi:hypothetical protein